MGIAGIVIAIIFLLFAVWGYRAGLIKKLSGILSVIIAALLVNALLPYVTNLVKTQTPLYDMIVTQCNKTVEEQLSNRFTGTSGGIDREQVRSLMQQYGLDSSQIDYLSDSELLALAQQYFGDIFSSGASTALDSLSRIDQTKLIQELPVPKFFQNMLLNYNNSEGYRKLGVQSFGDYLVHFIANTILNILSFIATLLVVYLLVRIIIGGLGIFSRLPVVRGVDHIGGLLLGMVQGLFFVWIILTVLSLFSGTQAGLQIMDMVNESVLGRLVNDMNVFLKIVTNAFGNII